MAKTDKSVEDIPYEQAFAELESIVEVLENQQVPLEETLKLFERGQMLVQRCSSLLETAELRIRQLVPVKNTTGNEE